jgi:hypothetical protein
MKGSLYEAECFDRSVKEWMDKNLVDRIDHFMCNSFAIADHFDISDYEDTIKEYAQETVDAFERDDDNIHDKVREIVSDLTFEVTVN